MALAEAEGLESHGARTQGGSSFEGCARLLKLRAPAWGHQERRQGTLASPAFTEGLRPDVGLASMIGGGLGWALHVEVEVDGDSGEEALGDSLCEPGGGFGAVALSRISDSGSRTPIR